MLRSNCLALGLLTFTALAQATDTIDVYRDPNCGCCKAWIGHLEDNGFTVNDHVEPDMSAVKQRLQVPPRHASCHTGVIAGKFVEGHVPATHVRELVSRSDLKGMAVPGMPAGSPGMEMGERRDAYLVIGIDAQGKGAVVADY